MASGTTRTPLPFITQAGITSSNPSACASARLTAKKPVVECTVSPLSGSAGSSTAATLAAHAIGAAVAAGSSATSVPAGFVHWLQPAQWTVAFQCVSLALEASSRTVMVWLGSISGAA